MQCKPQSCCTHGGYAYKLQSYDTVISWFIDLVSSKPAYVQNCIERFAKYLESKSISRKRFCGSYATNDFVY